MNFFFDRNIAVRIARMLDGFDDANRITHQDDDGRFGPRTSDVDIIEALAGEAPSPVLVTADLNMRRRNPVERAALAGSKLTVVFLRSGFNGLPFHTQAVKLLERWPDIVKETTRCREPSAFEISVRARKVQSLGPTRLL